MQIFVSVFLILSCSLQLYDLFKEKNISDFYLYKRLPLGKKYYLTMDVVEDKVVLLVVDIEKDRSYVIDKAFEKNVHIYFYSEEIKLTFNTITKKMRIDSK